MNAFPGPTVMNGAPLRANLPPLPERMRHLKTDHRGYPVPWFVAWIDGKPDFRVIGPGKVRDAVLGRRCWLCGEKLGTHMAFVLGCMCTINRINAEPPSHRECAEFAVKACPFLTIPKMVRNERGLPEEARDPAGGFIKRNPGSCAIWVTYGFTLARVHNGVLFEMDDPSEVTWWHEGRPATRAEVLHSIDTGFHLLRDEAAKEGPEAVAELERMRDQASKLLPVA